ncbi:protein kinase superfamily protein [Striga asiatica]|uniref:Protein kinase superfamily protein n=1 Tax=Striga asiatica TaxID=4170 RepID=A0A5A7QKD5_STRAF|nr:protein kinase superfamily protein [Striga asiatica]
MGCVSSKKARARLQGHSQSTKSGPRAEPGPIHVGPLEEINVVPSKSGPRAEPSPIHVGQLEEINVEPEKEPVLEGTGDVADDRESWNAEKSHNLDDVSDDLKAVVKRNDELAPPEIILRRLPEVQLAAAEWPAWLTAVAGEAVDGWVPLRSDTYQRLNAICGVEHCHSRGIMHRDIKTSNILVNNKGILKIADFGLANFVRPESSQQPLTSRVVTLWYRPPELLLGSTNYDESVDLWSVGCVFAELLIGRPLLKGRTEVEQLHKIFKLCGSPPNDYWRKSRFPLAKMFKPRQLYESTLRERCKEFPRCNRVNRDFSLGPTLQTRDCIFCARF